MSLFRNSSQSPRPSRRPIKLDGPSPFESNEVAEAQRREDAMGIMDPDVYGYLVLTLRRPRDGRKNGKMRVGCHISDGTWPIFWRTMRRIIKAGRDVYVS